MMGIAIIGLGNALIMPLALFIINGLNRRIERLEDRKE